MGTAYTSGPPATSNGRGERVFQHIGDLRAQSRQGYNPQGNLSHLLEVAEKALNQAVNLNTTFRRPDLAYAEYLRAYDVAMYIPKHPEYPTWKMEQPERVQRYRVLNATLWKMEEQYDNVKQIIVHNNDRNGVKPQAGQNGHTRTESAPTVNGYHSSVPVADGRKVKPTPSPKPEKLHGRAISTVTADMNGPSASNNMDALSARFANLRRAGTVDTSNSTSSIPSSIHSSPILMPSAGEYNGRPSFDTLSKTFKPHGPQGPRMMPNGNGPPSISIPSFPQPPAATYSPARNMETTGNIAPPRHSARSLASTSTRRSSMLPTSSASAHAPNGSSHSSDYFPAPTNGRPSMRPDRRGSINADSEPVIGAQRLYDYIQKGYNILLIDFRHRHEFDDGHIYASCIMCVEPLQVRPGISAEQLAESLEVNPEMELGLWNDRDSFDYVVYHDWDTQDSYPFRGLPEGKGQALRSLHECLFDFNQERPLRHTPLLLRGGIDAWTDLVGKQALMNSATAMQVKSGTNIRRRPLATRSTNGGSNLRIPKRSLRNVDQLGEEEEKQWRERARAESVALPQAHSVPEEAHHDGDTPEENGEAPDSAIEEFLRRFPDAGNIDRQAFASQRPTRVPPPRPAKVPEYPQAPPASEFAQAPTRPQPAAPRMSYTGVSDRAVSASTPQTRAASGQMTPYIAPKYLAANLRLPRTGLMNFGNTCYMNSIIQALSATMQLSIFYMDDTFRNQLQRDNHLGSKGVLSELYANLIRSLWKGDVDCLRPTTFRKYVRRIAEYFDNDEQQDAKEFLELLLDQLHEDLNKNWAKTTLRALTEKEEAQRERMPKLIVAKTEWARFTHRSSSFVQSLFAGQHASRLTCLTCRYTSTTYEAFTSISVEIPTDQRKWLDTHGRGPPTLQDCLRSYCSQEELINDNAWHCPRCKTTREAAKRITITRAPQNLVVHFKRFATSTSTFSRTPSSGGARKVRIPVDFPLTHLSLDPFMLPPPTPTEAASITSTYGPDSLAQPDVSMSPPYLYDAYAVVRHIGQTMQSGHYVCAARDPARKCWRLFNDRFVKDFDPEGLRGGERLQSDEAYIVFYSRVAGPGSAAGGQGGGGGKF